MKKSEKFVQNAIKYIIFKALICVNNIALIILCKINKNQSNFHAETLLAMSPFNSCGDIAL